MYRYIHVCIHSYTYMYVHVCITGPVFNLKSQITFTCHAYSDIFNLENFDKSFMSLHDPDMFG